MSILFTEEIEFLRTAEADNKKPLAYLRILHASFDAPPIDVVANGGLLAKNLSYKNFTSYMKVVPGNYNIKVFPTGNMFTPVLNTNIKVTPYSLLTLIVGDDAKDLKLFVIPDNTRRVIENKALIRFANISPSSDDIDVNLSNGLPLFKDIGFGEYTAYIELPPSVYHFKLISNDSGVQLLSIPNANLKAGKAYTIYAIGEPSKKAPLEVLIPLDGNSYIKF
ncbi:MAG: DUF4397 domain-containing protein [Clostridium sp.]